MRPRALLQRHQRRQWDKTAAPRSRAARRMTERGPAAAHFAAVPAVRPEQAARHWPRSRWRPAAIRTGPVGLESFDFARNALTCRRCSRQIRSTLTPAPQRAERGASKATRLQGAWLLTHTQQTSELSKHVASKQAFNLERPVQFRGAAGKGLVPAEPAAPSDAIAGLALRREIWLATRNCSRSTGGKRAGL
jgi:hypothetical protein